MNEDLKVFEQGWPGRGTVCGWGSQLEHTQEIREYLPRIIKSYGITSINDAGCGDLCWMQTLDFEGVSYKGYDVCERHTWLALREVGWDLSILDITSEDMRPADLVICRDVFIHLPNDMILKALDRFKRQHKFLLTTNFYCMGKQFPENNFSNFERPSIISMKHAKMDLRFPPFNLGDALFDIPEDYPCKTTSLWKLK